MMGIEGWLFNKEISDRPNYERKNKASDIKYHLQEDSSPDNMRKLAIRHGFTVANVRSIRNGNAYTTIMAICNCERTTD